MKILRGLGVLSAVGPSAQLMMQLTASTAASSGSEDADGEELVEPPEPEATEPPSRRAAIRRLDGRRFSGAQAACACGTMRASVCATAEVLVARQHAVSEPHTAHLCARLWTGRGAGSRLGRMERQRALVVLALRRRRARRVGVWSGAKAARAAAPPRATRGWIGGCYVHAEGSRATSQGCGQVADMRGSHNDATMAS